MNGFCRSHQEESLTTFFFLFCKSRLSKVLQFETHPGQQPASFQCSHQVVTKSSWMPNRYVMIALHQRVIGCRMFAGISGYQNVFVRIALNLKIYLLTYLRVHIMKGFYIYQKSKRRHHWVSLSHTHTHTHTHAQWNHFYFNSGSALKARCLFTNCRQLDSEYTHRT